MSLYIGNVLQKSLIDSSSEEGLAPDGMNGMIEFKNVTFHYPSREEVPVYCASVFVQIIIILCNVLCFSNYAIIDRTMNKINVYTYVFFSQIF